MRNITPEYEPEATWGWERERLLVTIHQQNTNWPKELLNYPFDFVYNYVLSPIERRIVTYKVADNLVDGEIAIKLGKTLATIKRHIYNIRKKYRLQEHFRSDNHPKVREKQYNKTNGQKGFIVRRKKK